MTADARAASAGRFVSGSAVSQASSWFLTDWSLTNSLCDQYIIARRTVCIVVGVPHSLRWSGHRCSNGFDCRFVERCTQNLSADGSQGFKNLT